MTPLASYTADHRRLVEAAAAAAELVDPVAFSPEYGTPTTLLKSAIRGPLVAARRRSLPRLDDRRPALLPRHSIRHPALYGGRHPLRALRRRRSTATSRTRPTTSTSSSRADYVQLFRIAKRASRERGAGETPPVMLPGTARSLRQNTIGYLDRQNLKRIRELGGRPKRGLLLTGPPGNGKTSACRWLRHECLRLGLEHQEVSPDAYQAARAARATRCRR